MIIPVFTNSSTNEEELVDIHRVVIYSVALNISAMVYEHNYGAIDIDYPSEEGFYAIQFASMS